MVNSPSAGVIEGGDGCSENMEVDIAGGVSCSHDAREETFDVRVQLPGSSDTPEASPEQPSPLLLLIPLTLGMGKVDPVYLPQIRKVLTFPQTVGIVGGRPGASLYFVGYQV